MSAPIHLVPPMRPFRLPYQRVSWDAPERVSLKRSNTWPAPELHTMAWAAAAFEPLPDDTHTAGFLPAFVPPPPPLSALALRVHAALPPLAAPTTPPARLPTPAAVARPPEPLAAPRPLAPANALAAPVAAAPLALAAPAPLPQVLDPQPSGRPLAAPTALAFAAPPTGVAAPLPAPVPASPPPATVADAIAVGHPKPRLIGLKDVVITLAVAAATAAATLAALALF